MCIFFLYCCAKKSSQTLDFKQHVLTVLNISLLEVSYGLFGSNSFLELLGNLLAFPEHLFVLGLALFSTLKATAPGQVLLFLLFFEELSPEKVLHS